MSNEKVKRGLDQVAAAAEGAATEKRGLPPVHLWAPAHVGEIDIVITRDGRWVHEGGVIGREALVRLFSTILRRDDDGVYLVTPVEKLKITVEDAPFIATAVREEGDALIFTTNVGDEVAAGADNPIRVEVSDDGEPRPYVLVRGGLEALITRPVFYELVEMAEDRDGAFGVASNGAWFDMAPDGAGA